MLLPTICLKDELEQIILENFANKNEWYSPLIEHDHLSTILEEALPKPKMNFSEWNVEKMNFPTNNFSRFPKILSSPSLRSDEKMNHVHMSINNTDFITNLCSGNIKSKYARIFWKFLSSNSSAIELLLKNQSEIYYSNFVNNRNPDAMYIIDKNIRILNRGSHLLSSNPSAIHLLQKYPWIVDPNELVKNTNPLAVDIMKKHNFPTNTFGGSPENSFSSDRSVNEKMNFQARLWNDCFLQNPLSVDAILEYLNITPSLLSSPKREDIDHIIYILNTRNMNWFYLSSNPHPLVVKILKLCPHRVFSQQLMINSCIDAIDLIRDNINSVSLLQKRRLIFFM
jgi:hypothetical protein